MILFHFLLGNIDPVVAEHLEMLQDYLDEQDIGDQVIVGTDDEIFGEEQIVVGVDSPALVEDEDEDDQNFRDDLPDDIPLMDPDLRGQDDQDLLRGQDDQDLLRGEDDQDLLRGEDDQDLLRVQDDLPGMEELDQDVDLVPDDDILDQNLGGEDFGGEDGLIEQGYFLVNIYFTQK